MGDLSEKSFSKNIYEFLYYIVVISRPFGVRTTASAQLRPHAPTERAIQS